MVELIGVDFHLLVDLLDVILLIESVMDGSQVQLRQHVLLGVVQVEHWHQKLLIVNETGLEDVGLLFFVHDDGQNYNKKLLAPVPHAGKFLIAVIQEQKMVDLFLPDHFAERMFELEAALEYEGSLQIIRDLNDLYRAGIDYYIEREPRKATHLQKKITSLLASPDNIRILQREAKKNNSKGSPLSEKEPEPSPSPTAGMPSLNTRKLKEELSKFHTVADTCIQSIVENSNKMADKMEKLRRRDINKQEEQLNDRIMLKRVRSQEKIMKIRSQTELPLATDEPGDGALSLRRMIQ